MLFGYPLLVLLDDQTLLLALLLLYDRLVALSLGFCQELGQTLVLGGQRLGHTGGNGRSRVVSAGGERVADHLFVE